MQQNHLAAVAYPLQETPEGPNFPLKMAIIKGGTKNCFIYRTG